MTEAQIWAALEERGYNRDYIFERIDRGYAARIIGYPKDEKGRYLQEEKPPNRDPVTSQVSHDPYWKLRLKMRREGWKESDIEETLRQIEIAQMLAYSEMSQGLMNQEMAYPGMSIPQGSIPGVDFPIGTSTESGYPVHPQQGGFPEVIIPEGYSVDP